MKFIKNLCFCFGVILCVSASAHGYYITKWTANATIVTEETMTYAQCQTYEATNGYAFCRLLDDSTCACWNGIPLIEVCTQVEDEDIYVCESHGFYRNSATSYACKSVCRCNTACVEQLHTLTWNQVGNLPISYAITEFVCPTNIYDGPCESRGTYSCRNGYYGSATSEVNYNCTICPQITSSNGTIIYGQSTETNNIDLESCYIHKSTSTVYKDTYGEFTLDGDGIYGNSKCYYQQ